MSLESILKRIINEANTQKELIIQDARNQAAVIIQEARKEAEKNYQVALDKQRAIYARQKKRLVVNARLDYKKELLLAKQELMEGVFKKLKSTLKTEKIKKQQISQDKIEEVSEDMDFYLNQLRQKYETEIARMLFP